MKAVVRDRYGEPDVLNIEDVSIPSPKASEALVRVVAASVNTADLDDLRGKPVAGRVGRGWVNPKTRSVGLDIAGRVEAVGDDVTRLEPGDAVWADMFSYGRGAFGEYVCAVEKAFKPKPAGFSFEVAATVPHSGLLALQGLRRGGITVGDRVLVNGAGGCVGPFAIQIAKSMGAEVTGVDHTEKLDLVRRAGADRVVDYTSEDVTRNGESYDRILDIAATRSFLSFRRSLSPGGVYALVARNMRGFLSAAVFGAVMSGFDNRRMGVFRWEPNKAEDLHQMGELIESGAVTPIVDNTYDLADTARAMQLLAEGRARGKLVINIG